MKAAIQMEKDGFAFYTKAAAQTNSDMGRSIFKSLAEDEELHLRTFEKIFEEQVGAVEWDSLVRSSNKYANLPIFPKDLTGVGGLTADSDELDALQFGMNSEKEAIEYYTGILDMTADPEVKKIFGEIIEQEKSHFMILEEEFHHLKKAGF